MIEILITLAVLTFLFWLGFHITGALLSAAIWLFIKLPFALILGCSLRQKKENKKGENKQCYLGYIIFLRIESAWTIC